MTCRILLAIYSKQKRIYKSGTEYTESRPDCRIIPYFVENATQSCILSTCPQGEIANSVKTKRAN